MEWAAAGSQTGWDSHTAGPETVRDSARPGDARSADVHRPAAKAVTVPGLAVGDVVEYDVVISAKPLLAGQFWHIWNFEQTAIALDEQLDLNMPANRAVKIKSPEGIKASDHSKETAGYTTGRLRI